MNKLGILYLLYLGIYRISCDNYLHWNWYQKSKLPENMEFISYLPKQKRFWVYLKFLTTPLLLAGIMPKKRRSSLSSESIKFRKFAILEGNFHVKSLFLNINERLIFAHRMFIVYIYFLIDKAAMCM